MNILINDSLYIDFDQPNLMKQLLNADYTKHYGTHNTFSLFLEKDKIAISTLTIPTICYNWKEIYKITKIKNYRTKIKIKIHEAILRFIK